MLYRLIISFSVVGFKPRSSAGFFLYASRSFQGERMSFFSKSLMSPRKEIPSSGTTSRGTREARDGKDVVGDEGSIDDSPFRQRHSPLVNSLCARSL